MISLLRNKRKIYVCALNKSDNGKSYDKPIELLENYQVTNSFVDEKLYGLDSYLQIRIKTNSSHAKYYHLGDRVYINNKPPKVHDTQCTNADYQVIKEPIITLNECEVLLKRRSGK